MVYFGDFKYTLIMQQSRITLLDLIYNLGNILGLIIAFKFITCLEIFEIFSEFFLYILYKLKFYCL